MPDLPELQPTLTIWNVSPAARRGLLRYEWNAGDIQSVQFSPDDSALLIASGSYHDGSTDTAIMLWDSLSGQPIRSVATCPCIPTLALFSPDGSQVVWCSGNTIIRYHMPPPPGWDGTTSALWQLPVAPQCKGSKVRKQVPYHYEQPVDRWGHSWADRPYGYLSIEAADWSPDGTLLATYNGNGDVWLWDAATLQPTAILRGHRVREPGLWDATVTISFRHDGQFLVSAGTDTTARVWHVASRRPVQVLPTPDLITSAYWTPDGNHVITTSAGQAAVWDVRRGQVQYTLTDSALQVHTPFARYSPDGTKIAVISGDVLIWDVAQQRFVCILAGFHPREYYGWEGADCVAWSHDSRRIVAGSTYGAVCVWDIA